MKKRNYNSIIWVVSIAIPAAVALLYVLPKPSEKPDVSFLPAFHAILNATTTMLLLVGYYFIRNKNQRAHTYCMVASLVLSVVFLLSYVTYHTFAESTKYGGTGAIKYVYYFILLTHILLAAVIVPFVLFTLVQALNGTFDKHRKIARWTLPMWLYVTITGVLVYLMIRPYY